MLSCMKDSAHDKEHVYRVLYTALDIAEQEEPVDYDILIAALYQGIVGDPLYLLDKTGKISDGTEDEEPSFFHEYKYKLEKLYTKFYTQRGMEIAASRQKSAEQFYRNMVKEVKQSYLGKSSISKHLLSSRKLQ